MENEAMQIALSIILWWELFLFIRHLMVSGWRNWKKSWLIVFPVKY